MVNRHHSIFLSINLVKLHMRPKSVDKLQQNRYFRENNRKKVSNLSDHHHMLFGDTTRH